MDSNFSDGFSGMNLNAQQSTKENPNPSLESTDNGFLIVSPRSETAGATGTIQHPLMPAHNDVSSSAMQYPPTRAQAVPYPVQQQRFPSASVSVTGTRPLTEKPMVLVKMDASGENLEINEDTLKWLSQQEKKISVASIVGPTGTGKSYLLNKFMGREQGFVYEDHIDGTTKGIWIWGMDHPRKKDQILLLMDTEGQQDVQRDECYDVQIALLTMLLSSVIIFNVVKKIGSDLIRQLGNLVGFAKLIHVNDQQPEDMQNLPHYLPKLVVLVRDFQSKLIFHGHEVTEDGYLNDCLQDEESTAEYLKRKGKNYLGLAQSNARQDQIQKINEMFPSNKRHCRVLPYPGASYNYTTGIPDFETAIINLKNLIQRIAHPKVFVKSDAVDGRLFAQLVTKYTNILNKGEAICIQPTYAIIAKEENDRLMTEGITIYKERMNQLEFPLTSSEFTDQHTKITQEIGRQLLPKVIFDNAENFREKLQTKFIDVYNEMVRKNENSSYIRCERILKSLHTTIKTKLDNNTYFRPGGYDLYKTDIDDLKKKYVATEKKGMKADEVLLNFMSEKESERTLIIQADNQMTSMKIQEEAQERWEEERKLREEQIRKEQEENQQRIETLMQQMEEMKSAFDQERQQREAQYEEQLEDQRRKLKEYENRIGELENRPQEGPCVIL